MARTVWNRDEMRKALAEGLVYGKDFFRPSKSDLFQKHNRHPPGHYSGTGVGEKIRKGGGGYSRRRMKKKVHYGGG